MWPPMQERELFIFAPARTTAVGSPKLSCFMREWPGVTRIIAAWAVLRRRT